MNKLVGKVEKEMSFLEHLEELRWHIIRSFIAIAVFAILAFVFRNFVFKEIIFAPGQTEFWTYQMLCKAADITGSSVLCIDELPFTIQSRKMTGQFTMAITASFVIGLIIAFPYVFYEIWSFISPGLYDKEKKLSRGSVFFVSLLFSMGILFGYYIVSPLSINFLANFNLDPGTVVNEFDIVSFVSTVTMLVLACGILFQLPVVVYFLTKAGIITPQLMRQFRRHSIVVILILSAILTPPDPMSQLLIAFPLLLLYEISIKLSAFVARKRDKEMQEILE